MSKRTTNPKEGSTKKRPISKRDASLFVKYGMAPPNVGYDEFHEKWPSYDWAKDPELPNNLSVLQDGKMKDSTRETLALIASFGSAFDVDGGPMPMEHWSRVTGYKEPTEEERRAAMSYSHENQFVLVDGDEDNEHFLKEVYGPSEPSTARQPKPVIISATPEKVDWSLFPGRQLLELTPFHFLGGYQAELEELNGDLATLQNRQASLVSIHKLLNTTSLKLYLDIAPLNHEFSVVQYYSSGNRMFVAILLLQILEDVYKLSKYFFIRSQRV